ncbi:MAG TPA: hypothetical protein VFT45_18140 [Longimicrobium sp.]|nr:hypothetical protein [Longimicrobium sp.]
MKRHTLSPEALQVESFPTSAPAAEAQPAAELFARTDAGPGCYPSHDRTCTC